LPWKEQTPVDERKHFIDAYRRADDSVAGLARRFGISRKTAYKWIHRFTEGLDLEDRSRRPWSNARAIAPAVVDALVAARKARPRWGAKKVRAVLAEANPGHELPSASAIAAIFKRHGLVRPKRRRRRTPRSTTPFGQVAAPNDLWCIDFKGDFDVGGRRCYPLTVTDAHSRYLIACVALRSTDERAVRRVLEQVFFEFGLPRAIRSDNGAPFASRGLGGFSKLSVWWLRLGIRHERIQPGKPQQNGRHERMHLTLKQATAMPPASTFAAQQRAFDLFRADFNDVRPHEALGLKPPARVYQPSSRPLPIPAWGKEFQYPHHWERVRLSRLGVLVWNERRVAIGQAFANELVGLSWTETGWDVHLGALCLGTCRWSDNTRRRRLTFSPAAHLLPMSVNKTVTHVSA
jgi:transposase InsO family protein